jgi:hypothetical protein
MRRGEIGDGNAGEGACVPMKNTGKQWLVFAASLCLWFLAADAYWTSKKRAVEDCTLNDATELVKHSITAHTFGSTTDIGRIVNSFVDASVAVEDFCKGAVGAGNAWDSVRGMAYWEVMFLAPVGYRFRFE